jgi:hypothetical protein
MITCKGPSGAVRSMHAGRQSHQHQPRTGVAEWRHWAAVVAGLLDVNGVQECRKTRAAPAISIENRIHAREGVSQRSWRRRKNGLRGSPRSPPSIALGLWTNPSATEPSPEGLRTCQTPVSRKRFLAVANIYIGSELEWLWGTLRLGYVEGSRSRIAPAGNGASRLFKNCRPCWRINRDIFYNYLYTVRFIA